MAMSRSREDSVFTTRSPIRRVPVLMSSSPATIRSAVLLPQPDGPTSTRNSPSRDVQVQVLDRVEAVLVLLVDLVQHYLGHGGLLPEIWSGELPDLERRPVAGQGHDAVGVRTQRAASP